MVMVLVLTEQCASHRRKQLIMLSINGRKPIPLEPKDAAAIISELAEALADGRDCSIEV